MLDEPCASLDPISTASIEELLLELSTDYSIVIVTHNLAQAKRISDKVAFFLMGRLLEFGDALQVFEAPQRPETAEYVAAPSASAFRRPASAGPVPRRASARRARAAARGMLCRGRVCRQRFPASAYRSPTITGR